MFISELGRYYELNLQHRDQIKQQNFLLLLFMNNQKHLCPVEQLVLYYRTRAIHTWQTEMRITGYNKILFPLIVEVTCHFISFRIIY